VLIRKVDAIMAVKTNAKKSTGKKRASTAKAKSTAGSSVMSEIDKAILSMTAGIAAANAEIEKLASMQQKTELVQQKTQKTVERLSRSIDNGLGRVRNSIGHIVEMVLLPGLSTKINALGHVFTKTSYGDVFKRADGSKLAEVDLFLENGREVMVVEAKTFFEEKDVMALLVRVQKLRKDEDLTGVAGKTIYAAAAGVNFAPEAGRMIEEKGIYLVEVNEENDRIKVKEISIDDAGTW